MFLLQKESIVKKIKKKNNYLNNNTISINNTVIVKTLTSIYLVTYEPFNQYW